MKNKLYIQTVIWTIAVWGLSFACYLPMLLKNIGVQIPEVLTAAKYLFVAVPFAVSAICASKQGFKKWFLSLFSDKIRIKTILFCTAIGAAGLIFSLVYSIISDDKDLFARNYPTFFSIIIGIIYLFFTAFIEECAWRGFLLNELSNKKGTVPALIYTGISWAVWHIPMWTIRNALGFGEIAFYFIWTVIVSVIIGIFYLSNKNVVTATLLHMLFNTCFIAPVQFNILPAAIIALVAFLLRGKPNISRTEK